METQRENGRNIVFFMRGHIPPIELSRPPVRIAMSRCIIPDERRRLIIDNRFFVSSFVEWHPLLIRKVGSCLCADSMLLEWRLGARFASAIKTSRKPPPSEIIDQNW